MKNISGKQQKYRPLDGNIEIKERVTPQTSHLPMCNDNACVTEEENRLLMNRSFGLFMAMNMGTKRRFDRILWETIQTRARTQYVTMLCSNKFLSFCKGFGRHHLITISRSFSFREKMFAIVLDQ